MTKITFSARPLILTVSSIAVLCLLSACQTTGETAKETVSGSDDRQARVNRAIERAAKDAHASGNTQDSLALVENLYKRNPKDADIATRYAYALRNENRLTRAHLILQPFAAEKNANDNVLAEYASIQTAMGNYAGAEATARRAIAANPESGLSYHVLGVALDAQGQHKKAEEAFRQGLEYWKGNPAPILNNLGLNLASQGFLDEAADTLRKAATTAPNRGEIERNLRIVNALQVSGGHVPSYLQQPEDEKKAEKKTDKKKVDHDAAYIPPAKPHPAPEVKRADAPAPAQKPAAKQ